MVGATRYCLAGAGAPGFGTVEGLAICVAVYGEVFVANLLTPRPHRLMRAISGIGRAQWILPALALWAIWAWSERKSFAARFTGLYVGVAFAAFLLQCGEASVDARRHPILLPSTSATVKMSLSPRPHMFITIK